MKLIILLTLLCSWMLTDCEEVGYDSVIGNQPYRFKSFPAGFPDGTLLTISYRLTEELKPDEYIKINFHNELKINVFDRYDIPVHCAVHATGLLTTDECSLDNDKCWTFTKKIQQETIWKKNLLDWRIDVYKIDDKHMAFWIEGLWSKVRKFDHKLSDIKSVYVFGKKINLSWGVDIKYRLPSDLVKPTPLNFFENQEKMFMPDTPAPSSAILAGHHYSSHNEVILPPFPMRKGLFLSVWFASKPGNKQGDPYPWPMIQFIPADFDPEKGNQIEDVLTLYLKWETDLTKSRKIYYKLFIKKGKNADMEQRDSVSQKLFEEECIVEHSVGDIAHFQFSRLIPVYKDVNNGGLYVRNYYLGNTCRTTAFIGEQLNKSKYFDKPFKIKGLNGATILHADVRPL